MPCGVQGVGGVCVAVVRGWACLGPQHRRERLVALAASRCLFEWAPNDGAGSKCCTAGRDAQLTALLGSSSSTLTKAMQLPQAFPVVPFLGVVVQFGAAAMLTGLFGLLRRFVIRRTYFAAWLGAWLAFTIAIVALVIRYLAPSPFSLADDQAPGVRCVVFRISGDQIHRLRPVPARHADLRRRQAWRVRLCSMRSWRSALAWPWCRPS